MLSKKLGTGIWLIHSKLRNLRLYIRGQGFCSLTAMRGTNLMCSVEVLHLNSRVKGIEDPVLAVLLKTFPHLVYLEIHELQAKDPLNASYETSGGSSEAEGCFYKHHE